VVSVSVQRWIPPTGIDFNQPHKRAEVLIIIALDMMVIANGYQWVE